MALAKGQKDFRRSVRSASLGPFRCSQNSRSPAQGSSAARLDHSTEAGTQVADDPCDHAEPPHSSGASLWRSGARFLSISAQHRCASSQVGRERRTCSRLSRRPRFEFGQRASAHAETRPGRPACSTFDTVPEMLPRVRGRQSESRPGTAPGYRFQIQAAPSPSTTRRRPGEAASLGLRRTRWANADRSGSVSRLAALSIAARVADRARVAHRAPLAGPRLCGPDQDQLGLARLRRAVGLLAGPARRSVWRTGTPVPSRPRYIVGAEGGSGSTVPSARRRQSPRPSPSATRSTCRPRPARRPVQPAGRWLRQS